MKKTFICALIVTFLPVINLQAAMNFEVLEENAHGLLLHLQSGNWQTLQDSNGVLYFPEGAFIEEREGGAQVPFYRGMIALPGNAAPGLSVRSVQWRPGENVRVSSGREADRNPRIPHLSSVGTVFLGEPFLWRKHWVADIYVVPLKMDGTETSLLKEITLEIDYPEIPSPGGYHPDELASSVLLNGNRAARWTVQPRNELDDYDYWPEGPLYRIDLKLEGVYKLSYEYLQSQGIDLSGFDPQYFRLYGNGGLVLPENFNTARDDHLRENAILVVGEEDGSWDPGDYILFYARSVASWQAYPVLGEYRHTHSPYEEFNTLWLNVSEEGVPGKRMNILETDETPDYQTNTARSRFFVENDYFIYYSRDERESGKEWYEVELREGDRYSRAFQAFEPLPDSLGVLWVGAKKASATNTFAGVRINGTLINEYSLSNSVRVVNVPSGILHKGNNIFEFQVATGGDALFDWFEISYWRELKTTTGRLEFDALPGEGVHQVTLSGITDPWIFNIENQDDVSYTRSNPFRVTQSDNTPNRFLAITKEQFIDPSSLPSFSIRNDYFGKGEYPDGLRSTNNSADYIYIVHKDFWEESARLEAHVEARDTVEVLRVDVDDVFKEFSWGLMDPTAIRDFLYYAQTYWTPGSHGPATVCLLIGDGDYDYRNLLFSGDKNWIPPYENLRNCRDDYFAEFQTTDPSYIMGRLPFQNENELSNFIDNLVAYDSEEEPGPWQSRMILVADDEFTEDGPHGIDQNHMTDSEEIYQTAVPSFMDVEKIYIGPYPTSFDPATGARLKPLATRQLIESINAGGLVINYIGHGNAHVWAHEQLFLDSRDRDLVNSGYRTPIYIAATCAWGHFDRPNNEAFFEQLLAKSGGAIGVVAASRNTSGGQNMNLLRRLYTHFFDRNDPSSMGESVFRAKLEAPGSTNSYYHYFGDPMMRPALAAWDVFDIAATPDSLTALRPSTVTASIGPHDAGIPDDSYDGEALITVIGGFRTMQYTFTQKINGRLVPGADFYYSVPLGLMFRGYATVENGSVTSTFMVPKDVEYGSDDARVQIFTTNEWNNAIGVAEEMQVASVSGESDDHDPPVINIYFNHRNWRDGDIVTERPTMIVDVIDSSGVNLTGEIGHELKALFDGGRQEIELTDAFTYERDSYIQGSASKILYDLSPGLHHVEVWAWDNANNLARQSVSLTVIGTGAGRGGDFAINNVYNVPNPFRAETYFTFEGTQVERATVKIFTPGGRLIRTLENWFEPEQSFYSIHWDGKDQYGDPVGNSVYLYKVIAENSTFGKSEVAGKAIRAR